MKEIVFVGLLGIIMLGLDFYSSWIEFVHWDFHKL